MFSIDCIRSSSSKLSFSFDRLKTVVHLSLLSSSPLRSNCSCCLKLSVYVYMLLLRHCCLYQLHSLAQFSIFQTKCGSFALSNMQEVDILFLRLFSLFLLLFLHVIDLTLWLFLRRPSLHTSLRLFPLRTCTVSMFVCSCCCSPTFRANRGSEDFLSNVPPCIQCSSQVVHVCFASKLLTRTCFALKVAYQAGARNA